MSYVYLSGAMRGIPQFNFPAFLDAEDDIADAFGDVVHVFSPAKRDLENGFYPFDYTGHEDLSLLGFDLREALEIDMAFITSTADAVVVLPGWEQSSGARAEVLTAAALGLPVFELADFCVHGFNADPLDGVTEIVDFHAGQELDERSSGWERLKAALWPTPRLWETNDVIFDGESFDPFDHGESFDPFDHGDDCEWCHPEPALVVGYGTDTFVLNVDPALDAAMDPRSEPDVEWTGDKEYRVVNPDTGGEKGQKLARFDLIPANVVTQLAEHYGKGALKYKDRNWERGYQWSLSFAAAMRHLWAFWNGQDIDPETGTLHVVSAAWHCFALADFHRTHPKMDDRVTAALDESEWRNYL